MTESSKPNAAKSAIEDYFNEVLGSFSNDPLIKPEKEEGVALKKIVQDKSPATVASPGGNDHLPEMQGQKESAQTTLFKDDMEQEVLAQVVIPSTLPKFVPAPSAQTSIASPLAPSTPFSVNTLPDIPAKNEVQQLSQKPATESEESIQPELDEVSDADVHKPPEWLENGRPSWGQNRFECLLFTVAGLKLAVPLISLGAIYRLEKEPTPLVGHADWLIGLCQSGDRNVQVVDTALWVMPERYSETFRKSYQFVIRLGGNNWGIACDAVEQAVQLEPSQVIWRTIRGKRPWLSGTVIDHMCALLDVDTLSYLFHQQEKSIG